jgi:hypothetical protein
MPSTKMEKPIDSSVKGYDVEKQDRDTYSINNDGSPNLEVIPSHVTNHDMSVADPYRERGDEVYDRFSHSRKMVMTAVLSFCGFLAPISSTAVLSAVPEVAATFKTNGSIINLTNALYLVFMGLSPVFWGPMGQVYGRRMVHHPMSLPINY